MGKLESTVKLRIVFFAFGLFVFLVALASARVHTGPPDSSVDFLIDDWEKLPFKDQRANLTWANYVNAYLNPTVSWQINAYSDGINQKIAEKCLSYAASTINDWFHLKEGSLIKDSYSNYLNNHTESGTNPRELESIYYAKPNFLPKYITVPLFDDTVTNEEIAYSTEGYADILTNPPSNSYSFNDPQISSINYRAYSNEYLPGYVYKEIPTNGPNAETHLKQALERYGIAYIHANIPYINLPIPVHALTLIGYNDTPSGTDFWYHDSYNGADFSDYSRYGTIRINEINKVWIFYDPQWANFHQNNRRTGFTSLKGDIDSTTSYIVWNSSGAQATDLFDSPIIAEISGGSEEGAELIVGTENADGDDGRVYALDGDTNTVLWSFNATDATHAVTVDDLNGDGEKEILVTDRSATTWALNKNGGQIWSYSLNNGQQAWANGVANLDNVGGKEIVFTGFNNTVLVSGSNYFPAKVRAYALDNNGNLKWSSPLIDNGAQTNPTIGNLDDDPYPEIVITTFFKLYVLNGEDGSIKWTKVVSGELIGAPVIADVDNDNQYEVVVSSADVPYFDCLNVYGAGCDNRLYVLNGQNGNTEWSQGVNYGIYASAAVANLDNDDNLEIIVVTNDGPDFHNYRNTSIGRGNMYSFDGGSSTQQWNFNLGAKVWSSPAIADIDGDGELEIVVGDYGGIVHIIDEQGNQEWTRNVGSYMAGSPALGDLDGDGVLEMAIKHAGGIGENVSSSIGGSIGRGPNIINITNSSNNWPPECDPCFDSLGAGEPSSLDILGGLNDRPNLNNISNITVNLTSLVNLNISGQLFATDPENDSIKFYFSSPFNSSGIWQTNSSDQAGIYPITVEATDGNLSHYQQLFVTVVDNRSPQTPNIIYPVGGASLVGNYVEINWTQSIDLLNNLIMYNLQYSNNSGSSWYQIKSNYGYENKLNTSLDSANLTFIGNEDKTVYLRIPKNAKVRNAKLNLEGSLL
jgi:outer membrane protein assembly factor BamB